GDTTATVTALGVEPGASSLPADVDLSDGSAWLSTGAAEDLGASAGDDLAVAGSTLTVAGVSARDDSYSHTPVVWTTLADWQAGGVTGAAAGADGDGADGGAAGGSAAAGANSDGAPAGQDMVAT